MATAVQQSFRAYRFSYSRAKAYLNLLMPYQQKLLFPLLFSPTFKPVLEHSHYVGELNLLIYKKLTRKNFQTKNSQHLPNHIIYLSGLLHDIGKKNPTILSLINKPRTLTLQEKQIVQQHTNIGHKILKAIDIDPKILEVTLTHHESWDGNGYPNRIKGTKIPFLSRITSLADYIEAVMETRPYNRARRSYVEAVKEIEQMEMNHYITRFQPNIFKIAKEMKFEY